MIEAQALSKKFGAVRAAQDISFVARDGEITGVLGPNGAGKSTTLRMLYGVLAADSGHALIDGIDVASHAAEARARLGVLPHAAGIYANLSGRENIAYFGELHGLEAATLRARTEALVDKLGMQDFAHRLAKGYSQGQKLKTALARALVHGPRNVILDEPTNGLDVMAIRALRDLLRQLAAEGRCIVFSSHVMQEVAALCDRVIVIGAGRILAVGTPAELRAKASAVTLEDAFLAILGDAGTVA
jgi:sodium transport system ATP-binding protein